MDVTEIRSAEGILMLAVLEILKVKGIITEKEQEKFFEVSPAYGPITATEMLKCVKEAFNKQG